MQEKEKVYPEWVQAYRTRGNTVKKKGDSYYLYKRTSKRIPGKKYPQPVDTYVGLITPSGIVRSERKMMKLSDISVREYGFTYIIKKLCPESWKTAHGSAWEDILNIIILKWSPDSYIQDKGVIKDEKELHLQIASQMASLSRKIYKECHVEMKELEVMKRLYLVTSGKSSVLSKLRPEQEELLARLGMELEVE